MDQLEERILQTDRLKKHLQYRVDRTLRISTFHEYCNSLHQGEEQSDIVSAPDETF